MLTRPSVTQIDESVPSVRGLGSRLRKAAPAHPELRMLVTNPGATGSAHSTTPVKRGKAIMKASPEMHVFGGFVHGVLVAFHGLGCLYNKKRGNDLQKWLHLAVGLYDLWAVNEHVKGMKE